MDIEKLNTQAIEDKKCLALAMCGRYGVALRDTGPQSFQRYVVHRFNLDLSNYTTGYYWGHYFKNFDDALADFQEVVTRLIEGERPFFDSQQETPAQTAD